MINQAWLIPALPFVAFAVIILFTRHAKQSSSFLAIGAIGTAFVLSCIVFLEAYAGQRSDITVPWITLGGTSTLPFGFRVDALTAIMLVVVTSVSLLVHIYSTGYMRRGHSAPHATAEHSDVNGHGAHAEEDLQYDTDGLDRGYGRYFAFLCLFTFSMLGLVLSNNLLSIYLFWEGVGLGSYLLIGFWYHKPEAAAAAKKAFVTTRFGDFGMLLGILYLWWRSGTLNFLEIQHAAEAHLLSQTDITIGVLLIFAGAVGKSAQFPLHVWLPDAMEGPTPVSALIHAATMVAAGVYLVARMFPVFEESTTAMSVVALIGGFTAIFAASMGLVATDIKRVMAFSTVSQLGYMMLGLGSGALAAGVFHLFTHAFFKALLFLTAGSVIHSTESQEVKDLGGLWRVMPITGWTMVIASLSLAGIPPLSGFWSKDEILLATFVRSQEGNGLYTLLFAFGLITVFLTAFYMFRVIFLTFGGTYRGQGHPHESPPSMTIPLVILAIPSIVVGLWGAPMLGNGFAYFLEDGHPHHLEPNLLVAGLSVALAVGGIGLAAAVYLWRTISAEAMTERFRPIYNVLVHKYWIDELYNALIGGIFIGGAAVLAAFDRKVIDGVVNGAARGTVSVGGAVRSLQTGRVQSYALAVFGGLAIIAFFLVVFRVR